MPPPPPGAADAARSPLARWQAASLIALPLALALGLVLEPRRTLAWSGVALLALYAAVVGLKVIALLAGLARRRPMPTAAPANYELPVYTVLVPLYREAAVVPRLIAALEALDYPRDLLDAKLLVEA